MKVMGVSERFACRVAGQNRTTQRREPLSTTMADPDAALRTWLRQYAKDHPRRGFRPAYHDARGEGWAVNHKKIQRLWREEGLRVPQRRRRKRLGTSTAPERPKADAPNRVWAVDFQFDATTEGPPHQDRIDHRRTHPRPARLFRARTSRIRGTSAAKVRRRAAGCSLISRRILDCTFVCGLATSWAVA
jgi:transposase InsO family protein